MNDSISRPMPQTEAEAEVEFDRLLADTQRILRDMNERQKRIDQLRDETQAILTELEAFQFSR